MTDGEEPPETDIEKRAEAFRQTAEEIPGRQDQARLSKAPAF